VFIYHLKNKKINNEKKNIVQKFSKKQFFERKKIIGQYRNNTSSVFAFHLNHLKCPSVSFLQHPSENTSGFTEKFLLFLLNKIQNI